jgi:hypothetical protein
MHVLLWSTRVPADAPGPDTKEIPEMSHPRPSRIALIALVAASGLAAPVWANEPEKKDGQHAPLLTGPKVEDRDVPGVANSFGAFGEGQRRFANRVPPQVLNEAFEGLLADDAPADIRATPEQAEQIKALRSEFQAKSREFQREHRDELQRLRRAAGDYQRPRAGQRPGGPPPQDGMQPEAENKEALPAREQFRELMEKAPKAEDVQVRAWKILSEKQKEYVEGEIKAFRDQEEMRRAERYVQERMQNREDAPPPPKTRQKFPRGQFGPDDRRTEPGQPPMPGDDREGAGAGGPPPRRPFAGAPADDRVSPERRNRILRLFASLSPEQQDQLLQRLENRLREEGAEGGQRGARRPDRDGAPKPAPKMENVPLPDAEDVNADAPPRR